MRRRAQQASLKRKEAAHEERPQVREETPKRASTAREALRGVIYSSSPKVSRAGLKKERRVYRLRRCAAMPRRRWGIRSAYGFMCDTSGCSAGAQCMETCVDSGSDFWRFSLLLYRRAGVPPACIALQDGHGLDVNIMLFALWLASKGRAIEATDLALADAAVSGWRRDAVIALRGVRRYLREPPSAIDLGAAASLRDRVKAVELESERLQQEALFALRPSGEWGRPEEPARAAARNMDACAVLIGARFEDAPRAAILEAFRALLADRAS